MRTQKQFRQETAQDFTRGARVLQVSMLLATQNAVYRLLAETGEGHPTVRLRARGVRRVAEGQTLGLVALGDGSLIVLEDQTSRTIATGIEEPIESLLILGEQPLEVLIGTEGAHLFRLRGESTGRIASFDQLECRDAWFTPWGGPPAVRSLAATPDGWVYADIHVGSIMRSSDRGETWEPVTPELHQDVHQVNTCAASPERVYANTARAVYVSDDRGQSWHHRARDLGERYGRAIAVAPDDPDLLLATVSDGPHGENVHGQLYRSEDAGRTWQHVADGFPASTRANVNTFHVAFTPDGAAWAIVGKTLYCGEDRAQRWWEFWKAPEPLLMLASRQVTS